MDSNHVYSRQFSDREKKLSQIGLHVASHWLGTGPWQYSLLLPQQLAATVPISIMLPPQAPACSFRNMCSPSTPTGMVAPLWPKSCGIAQHFVSPLQTRKAVATPPRVRLSMICCCN